MKNDGKAMVLIVAYILTMLLISLVAIVTIRNIAKIPSKENGNNESESAHTEIIYIPVYAEPESESEPEKEETVKRIVYTVKSYEGRIGIFENGELTYLLDVYINTLPKTDRKLLEEGIVAYTEAELRDIIEDYTA